MLERIFGVSKQVTKFDGKVEDESIDNFVEDLESKLEGESIDNSIAKDREGEAFWKNLNSSKNADEPMDSDYKISMKDFHNFLKDLKANVGVFLEDVDVYDKGNSLEKQSYQIHGENFFLFCIRYVNKKKKVIYIENGGIGETKDKEVMSNLLKVFKKYKITPKTFEMRIRDIGYKAVMDRVGKVNNLTVFDKCKKHTNSSFIGDMVKSYKVVTKHNSTHSAKSIEMSMKEFSDLIDDLISEANLYIVKSTNNEKILDWKSGSGFQLTIDYKTSRDGLNVTISSFKIDIDDKLQTDKPVVLTKRLLEKHKLIDVLKDKDKITTKFSNHYEAKEITKEALEDLEKALTDNGFVEQVGGDRVGEGTLYKTFTYAGAGDGGVVEFDIEYVEKSDVIVVTSLKVDVTTKSLKPMSILLDILQIVGLGNELEDWKGNKYLF